MKNKTNVALTFSHQTDENASYFAHTKTLQIHVVWF